MSSVLDPDLVGWWKVRAIAMPEGKVLGLIGGLPGERVQFTKFGTYKVYPSRSGSLFRCRPAEPFGALDIWIEHLESLMSLCIYSIDDDLLHITVAAHVSLEKTPPRRPTAMRRDDKRNWVTIEMERCKSPVRQAAKKQAAKKQRPKK
jgi:hypothetical protein